MLARASLGPKNSINDYFVHFLVVFVLGSYNRFEQSLNLTLYPVSDDKSIFWTKLGSDSNDENHETGQIQAKGPSGEGRRPKWRRTKPPSGEG